MVSPRARAQWLWAGLLVIMQLLVSGIALGQPAPDIGQPTPDIGQWAPSSAEWTPKIVSPVTDLPDALSAQAEIAITAAIESHRAETNVQIAVLVIDTTRGEPIEDFAQRVAVTWGGGSKKKDDGVLYVLALKDRRARISVGYGLEDKLTDGRAKRILVDVRPHLRRGDHARAVAEVVRGIVGASGGTAPPIELPAASNKGRVAPDVPPNRAKPRQQEEDDSSDSDSLIFVVMFSVFGFFILLSSRRQRGGGSAQWYDTSSSNSSSSWSSSSWSSSSSSSSSFGSSGGSDWSGGGGDFGGGGASDSW